MSYYDPLYAFSSQSPYEPLYEQTKNQIQRSILTLEEKLRKRRELDYEIDYMRADSLLKPIQPLLPQVYPYPATQILREQQLRVNSILAQDRLREQIQEDSIQHEYALRLEKLRRQRQCLQNDMLLDRRPIGYEYDLHSNQLNRSPYRGHDHHKNNFISYEQGQRLEQDDELIKKYQDGTKAKEYLHDLDTQLKKKGNPEERGEHWTDRGREEDSISKEKLKKSQIRSPYDRIKYQSDAKNYTASMRKEEVQQNLQPKFNRVENRAASGNFHENNSKFQPQTNHKTPKTLQIIKQFKKSPSNLSARGQQKQKQTYRLNRVYSTSKKIAHHDRMNRSRSKSKRQLKYSKLQNGRSQLNGLQADALKKIENRLKLSQIIYEDSQFRNIKHEIGHLFNTYQNQLKIRKQVKDKINSNPIILRKHAMVVE